MQSRPAFQSMSGPVGDNTMTLLAYRILALVLALTPDSILAFGPPLQLESVVSDLTSVVKERDRLEIYDRILPKHVYKGQMQNKLVPLLPRTVLPLHYDLRIRPIIGEENLFGKRFTADGLVNIRVRVLESTQQLSVNSHEVEVVETSVNRVSAQKLPNVKVEKVDNVQEEEVHKITLNEPLDPEFVYNIKIRFRSLVARDRLVGLYASNYTDPDTNQVYHLATTQFESTHARKAFPCFDEPDLKATFSVSVGRQEGYNSVSNMELLETEPIPDMPGWFWDHYKTTPVMSTYLIAFIVSKHMADELKFGSKTFRTWAPKHVISSGTYATKTAGTVLTFYEKYFDYDYPLPKMDSVAIPHFRAGAMENWGLNTYKYSLLLYDRHDHTEMERFGVTHTIAHELAHQNFGNLVTCKSWAHLWLNEGFATYVSYLGFNEAAPELKPWDYMFSRETARAMKSDVYPDAHALVNISEANALSTGDFDKITYGKGASILLMMRGIVGDEVLQKSMQVYLRKYAYNSATTREFMAELDSVAAIEHALPSGLSLEKIMNGYLYKPSYPVVRVSIERSNPHRLYFTQEQFSSNHSRPDPNDSTEHPDLWWIPMSVRFSTEPDFTSHKPDVWLSDDHVAKQWHIPNRYLKGDGERNDEEIPFKWVIVNHDAYGYYRVLYDRTLSNLIQIQLSQDHTVFPSVTRAKLIDDQFQAALANYIPYSSALDYTNYLSEETEHVVWNTVLTNIKRIHNMLHDTKKFDLFSSYFQPKIVGALKVIGFEQQQEETGLDVMLRANLLDWACNMGNPECIQYARRSFKTWVEHHQVGNRSIPIPPDVRPVLLCSAVATPSTKENDHSFLFLWNRFKEEKRSVTRQNVFVSSMACTSNKLHLNFLIKQALNTTSKMTISQATVLLQRLAANSVGRPLLLQKLNSEFPAFMRRFEAPEHISYIFTALAMYVNTGHNLKVLQGLIAAFPKFFEPVKKTVQGALNTILSNIDWVSKYESKVASWLEMKMARIDAERLIF